jgi:hypothetical protein
MLFLKIPPRVQLCDMVTGEPILEPTREAGADAGDVRPKVDDRNRQILRPVPPWNFFAFLDRAAFKDPKWPKGEKGARAARRLMRATRKAEDLAIVQVDTDDVKITNEVLKDPEGRIEPSLLAQCDNFYLALEKASEKREDVEALVYEEY